MHTCMYVHTHTKRHITSNFDIWYGCLGLYHPPGPPNRVTYFKSHVLYAQIVLFVTRTEPIVIRFDDQFTQLDTLIIINT